MRSSRNDAHARKPAVNSVGSIRALDVREFAQARIPEIRALVSALKPDSFTCQLGAAALPRHLRRRARSHHPFRYRFRPNLKIRNITPGVHNAKRARIESQSTPIRRCRASRRRPGLLQKQHQQEQELLQRHHAEGQVGRPVAWEHSLPPLCAHSPTHCWAAKRFTMRRMWGVWLPQTAHGKGHGGRAVHTAARTRMVLRDAADHVALQLRGSKAAIVTALAPITHPKTSFKLQSKAAISGERVTAAMLHKAGLWPRGAVAPVELMWAPASASKVTRTPARDAQCTISTAGNTTGAGTVAASAADGVDSHTAGAVGTTVRDPQGGCLLWVWVHVSAVPDAARVLGHSCRAQGVHLALASNLHRLDLLGNTSTSAIHTLLACASVHSEAYSNKVNINISNRRCGKNEVDWGSMLAAMRNASAVHVANMQDPRDTAWARGREFAVASATATCASATSPPTSHTAASEPPLATHMRNYTSMDATAPKAAVAEACAATLPAHTQPEELLACGGGRPQGDVPTMEPSLSPAVETGQRAVRGGGGGREAMSEDALGALRRERRRRRLGQSQGNVLPSPPGCPVTLVRRQVDSSAYGGWSIILPSSFTMAFWMSLVRMGARAIGVQEYRWLMAEADQPQFPFDFPDTQAYAEDREEDMRARRDAYLRRPRSKQPPYPPSSPIWAASNASADPGHPPTSDSPQDCAASQATVIRDLDGARACLAAGSSALAMLCTMQISAAPSGCTHGKGVSNSAVNRALRSDQLKWQAKPAQVNPAEGFYERGFAAREARLAHLLGPRHLVRVRVLLPERGRCQEGASLCVPTPEDESAWFQSQHSATWKGVDAVPFNLTEPQHRSLTQEHVGDAVVSGRCLLSKRNSRASRHVLGYITSAQAKCAYTGTGAVGFCFVEPLAELWSRQFVSGAQGREGIFLLMCSPQSTFQRPALVQLCPMYFS